jgi:hypothetical protein
MLGTFRALHSGRIPLMSHRMSYFIVFPLFFIFHVRDFLEYALHFPGIPEPETRPVP